MKIREALMEASIRPEHVRCILLTHPHLDHAGSAAEVKSLTRAEVIAHERSRAILETGARQLPMTPTPGRLNKALFRMFVKDVLDPLVVVDHVAVDGEELFGLDGLKAIHSIGHIAFLSEEYGGVLFAGDAASNTFGLRYAISYEDFELGKKSLVKIAKHQFAKACFGHGSVVHSFATPG